jgi:hypothetical protein
MTLRQVYVANIQARLGLIEHLICLCVTVYEDALITSLPNSGFFESHRP